MVYPFWDRDPDKYARKCERCGGTGIDPVPGSDKADAMEAAALAIEKVRADLEVKNEN